VVLLAAFPGAAETADQQDPAAAEARKEVREAVSCWRRLARVDLGSTRHPGLARPAIDRLFATAQGRALVTDLCGLFIDPTGGEPRSLIEVRFVDRLPECRDGTEGCFRPATPFAERYEVFVRPQYPDAAADPDVFVFGEYPGNPNCSIVFFYQEAASAMAQTLYHELLHVWFLNAFAFDNRSYPTGHGVVSRCEFEEEFFDRLRAHVAELAALEGRQPPSPQRLRVPTYTELYY
jgi:hypothetical protein